MERTVTAQKKKEAKRIKEIYRLYITSDHRVYFGIWAGYVI